MRHKVGMLGHVKSGWVVLAALSAAQFATAQTSDDFSAQFGAFLAQGEAHSVDIYAEEFQRMKAQTNASHDEITQALDQELGRIALCSRQRYFLASRTSDYNPDYMEDATRLLSHYDLFAKATERENHGTVAAAEAALNAKREQMDQFVKSLYGAGRDSETETIATQRKQMSALCDRVSLLARNVDHMSSERRRQGN